jgi:esterase/lipase superfamily enzyme
MYGTAFVDGLDIKADQQGFITSIQDTNKGAFTANVAGDLSNAGRNLLVFIHGFDNTFEDGITRAAFNREFLATSGKPGTDTTVLAFSWPSLGKIVSFPVLDADYRHDQKMATLSGVHLMSFFAQTSAACVTRQRMQDLFARSLHGQFGAPKRGGELVPS